MLKRKASISGILVALMLSTTTFAQVPSNGEAEQAASEDTEIQEPAEEAPTLSERRRQASLMVQGRDGAEQNVEAGVAELEALIAEDYAPAMVTLAEFYISGSFVTRDQVRGQELLESAYALDESGAVFPLARLLRSTEPEQAAALLLERTEDGHGPSARLYAEMQFKGEGLQADAESATDRLEQLGAGGDASAYLLLANLYADGTNIVPADPERAVTYYESAIDLNLRSAKRTLGNLLLNGNKGVTPDPVRGLELLEEAADDGDTASAREYAQALIEGPEEIRDVPAGIARYENLSEAGDVSATLALSNIYMRGEVVPADTERAVSLLETAADSGNATALTRLASAARTGASGVDADAAEALALYEEAAATGNASAAVQAADMIIRGEGTEADIEAGIAQLEELGATGRTEPYVYLADMFLSDDGRVEADPERGVDYYQAAADLGHGPSTRNLARILLSGEMGVDADPERGYALLEAASARGDRAALRALAAAKIAGQGTEQDIEGGIADLEQLVVSQDAAASLDLAALYLDGDLVPADPEKARQLLSDAADNGSMTALIRLAGFYESGNSGIAQDNAAAFSLYERGAEIGDRRSKRQLAGMLLAGRGSAADVPRAIELYEELGDARQLATIYIRGDDVRRDVQRGLSILNEAVARQDASATQFLASAYRTGYGNRVPRSLSRASELIETSRDWLPPATYHAEAALIAAASQTRQGYDDTVVHLQALEPAQAARTFRQLRNVNRNAYVFAAQTRLAEMGLYSGSINGMLGTSTIRAINALCASEERTPECRLGPLSPPAGVVLSEVLFERQ